MIHAGPHDHWQCPACRHQFSQLPPSGNELPDLNLSRQKFQATRLTTLVVLVLCILLGGLVFFQAGLTPQENSIRYTELTVLTILGIAAGFVWAYTEFALTLKSRR